MIAAGANALSDRDETSRAFTTAKQNGLGSQLHPKSAYKSLTIQPSIHCVEAHSWLANVGQFAAFSAFHALVYSALCRREFSLASRGIRGALGLDRHRHCQRAEDRDKRTAKRNLWPMSSGSVQVRQCRCCHSK